MISINLLSSFLFPHWQYNINFKMTFIQISRNSIKMHMYDTCDLHLPLMTSLYFSWHHCLTAYRATALTHSKQIDNLRKWSQSCSVVFDSLWSHGLYSPWSSLGQNTGVGSFSLLQVLFPNQGLNPGLPHCRWILYQLSHKGSPKIIVTAIYRALIICSACFCVLYLFPYISLFTMMIWV